MTFKDEPYYIKKMSEELTQEIDKELLGKLEDMLKCSKHKVSNCYEIECKSEIKFRMLEWETEDLLNK